MLLIIITTEVILPKVGNAEDIIGKIVVQGNERIETETVKSYLSISSGDIFSVKQINSSLKALFATGLFADVLCAGMVRHS